MASITPTTSVNPQTMTSNWTSGLQNPANAQKLVQKYLNPKRAFNADPAGAQQAWQTGIARAQSANKYANGMAGANLAQAAQNMQQYGATNWSNAGSAKAYKYAAVAPQLAAAINQVQQTVQAMPKGKGQNNINRMVAWANGMSQYYGKIKS